ncbi:unnamed protein product, partial [Heterosigma akashiwo]
ARQLETEGHALRAQLERAHQEAAAKDHQVAELGRELAAAQEENAALQAEMDAVARELLSEAKQRAADQERWHQKLEEAQGQLGKAT